MYVSMCVCVRAGGHGKASMWHFTYLFRPRKEVRRIVGIIRQCPHFFLLFYSPTTTPGPI
jgi:hypothetical protein